jgi:hypothetical protein
VAGPAARRSCGRRTREARTRTLAPCARPPRFGVHEADGWRSPVSVLAGTLVGAKASPARGIFVAGSLAWGMIVEQIPTGPMGLPKSSHSPSRRSDHHVRPPQLTGHRIQMADPRSPPFQIGISHGKSKPTYLDSRGQLSRRVHPAVTGPHARNQLGDDRLREATGVSDVGNRVDRRSVLATARTATTVAMVDTDSVSSQ